ncbi:Zinc finger HIT domain-containing protein 2 [Coemansia sp. RSA 1939]|nr:Zinc finger HIT domain-containing protein 2 [Coemansia sp. RSA 1939]KAJ2612501.1 Zinc finger HIT domain-containing protein 2 [Coemansia sp. RSA 1804]
MHRIVQRYKDQVDNDNLAIGNPNAYSSDDDKSDEGRDEASILERLEGIDLNNNDDDIPAGAIWDRLTADEQKDFIRLVESEQISNLITTWHPWWDPSTEPKIVEIVDSGADKEPSRTLDGVPKIITVDKPVSKLAKKVHPSVLFQIVQIW